MVTVVDVHDERTWPHRIESYWCISPAGFTCHAWSIKGSLAVKDGKKTTVINDGFLVLTPVNLVGMPRDTFLTTYTNYPEEWK